MAGRFVLQEIATGARSTGRLSRAPAGALRNLINCAAVRPGMVVPSNHEILRGGAGALRNLFNGAAVRPGMVVPSNHVILRGRAAGRSRNGRPSRDLLHEQNMKIIRLQNEIEIAKADMEVLRADMKLEVAKGQTTMLKYCCFIVGAGFIGSWFCLAVMRSKRARMSGGKLPIAMQLEL